MYRRNGKSVKAAAGNRCDTKGQTRARWPPSLWAWAGQEACVCLSARPLVVMEPP